MSPGKSCETQYVSGHQQTFEPLDSSCKGSQRHPSLVGRPRRLQGAPRCVLETVNHASPSVDHLREPIATLGSHHSGLLLFVTTVWLLPNHQTGRQIGHCLFTIATVSSRYLLTSQSNEKGNEPVSATSMQTRWAVQGKERCTAGGKAPKVES